MTLLVVFAMLCLNINASGPKNQQDKQVIGIRFHQNYEGGPEVKMGIVSYLENEYVVIRIDAGAQGATDRFCEEIARDLPGLWNYFLKTKKEQDLPIPKGFFINTGHERLAEVVKNFLMTLKR